MIQHQLVISETASCEGSSNEFNERKNEWIQWKDWLIFKTQIMSALDGV